MIRKLVWGSLAAILTFYIVVVFFVPGERHKAEFDKASQAGRQRWDELGGSRHRQKGRAG